MMFLVVAALVPAIALMIYVYNKDRIEKEPPGLILRLFVFGALSTFAAMGVELLLTRLFGLFLSEESPVFVFIDNFLIVALTEEYCKRAVAVGFTWRHPAFNFRFDAVVYAASSALGFAALENVLYVLMYGFGTALTRAVLSVPLHGFCGVFTGLYLGQAKACECVGNERGKRAALAKSLVIPTLMHGFYDFCLSVDGWYYTVIFLVFVVVMYVVSLRAINRSAREDCPLAANWRAPFYQYLAPETDGRTALCPYCGAPSAPGSRFCHRCGRRLF